MGCPSSASRLAAQSARIERARPSGTHVPPVLRMPPFVTIRAAVAAPARAQRTDDEPLVVAELVLAVSVRVGGVEHRDPGLGCRGDRVQRALLVAILVRREAHAAEADAQLAGTEPVHHALAGRADERFEHRRFVREFAPRRPWNRR